MSDHIIHGAQAGQGGLVNIACINLATVDLGLPLDNLVAALQKCYDQHFLPVWGYPVKLYVTKTPAPSDWRFVFLDDADAPRALGYHDLTKGGQPVSKIFVRTTQKAGEVVSVTACHELFEMVIDPLANLWAQDGKGVLWAYEMCDAVEEDTFEVDGIPMSNFVHPAYFEVFRHPPGTKFDHLGVLKRPFTITKGGYSIQMVRGRVKNVFASKAKEKRFAKEDRRGHRSEYRKPNGLMIPKKRNAPGRTAAKRRARR